MKNQQWLIAGNPYRREIRLSDFELAESDLAPLGDGQAHIKVDYLEFTPSLKGQMENRLSYAKATALGEVMRGRGIGTVIESRSDELPIGARVHGYLGWQQFTTITPDEVFVRPDDEFLRYYLGPLGSTGMAAYFGLFDAGQPRKGDTVLISGAAGGVGSMVGQMAKIHGCTVIGVAGGPAKCEHLLDTLGIEYAIDYRSENIAQRIKALAPDGIDVVFDNVGGDFLEAALDHLAVSARIVICGAITRYEMAEPPPGPANYFNLVLKRATMRGILSPDYADRFPEAVTRIREWLERGEFRYVEDIQHGFDNIPATFKRLFTGANIGKQLLKL